MSLTCKDCGNPSGEWWVTKSGVDCSSNVALAHRVCNSRRGARLLQVA